MSVYQMVYISAQTVEFDDASLRELLAVARKNNQAAGISGMLLYHEGSFIQVLEGDREDVERLFNKIGLDGRHANTTVIFKGHAEERTFEEWGMGFLSVKALGDIPDGFHPFLRSGFVGDGATDTESAVRGALLAFKEGRWRAQV